MTRFACWTAIMIVAAAVWVRGAEQTALPIRPDALAEEIIVFGRAHAPLELHPDARRLVQLRVSHTPVGEWGGVNCPSIEQMRALVDAYVATPNPLFPDKGSTTAGLSTSWSSRDCGSFTYAAGLRSVENDKALTPATLMTIASMTKPIIAALTLMLNEHGTFGPQGLDTPVDQLLTPQQISSLTVGDDPLHPQCPGSALLWNRQTQQEAVTTFTCPDLSQVSLRNLMVSNHGMYDFLQEVGSATLFAQYWEGLYFEVLQFLGLPAIAPPNASNGFDVLKAYGLKRNTSAVIGGNLVFRDLEPSFGNTGFQLLGIILEHQTGRSLDDLIRTLIVDRLGIDDIFVYLDAGKRRNGIADGYDVETGEPLIEATGVYPIVSLNGHTAVNSSNLGLGIPGNVNLAGGAGGLVANPTSYRVFLDAFVNGGLLGEAAQADFADGFVLLPELTNLPVIATFNGFGLVKQTLRNFPGVVDQDFYNHGGSLPGARCENAVVRRPDATIAPVTGTFCKNSNGWNYPSTTSLLLGYVELITTANPGEREH